MRRAIVAGGSMGGLFAAASLRRAGWQVDLYERSDVELAGRGAGIVTHDVLIDALRRLGANLDNLGVEALTRTAFDRSGNVVATLPYRQIVTSWDRLHRALRELLPDEHHHLGCHVTGYRQTADSVTALFADGRMETADLLVAADGFRSALRTQMLPQVVPEYAGYVVWRALTPEASLSPDARRDVFPTFGFYAPAGTQIIGYPIAGPDNDLRVGHRRYNFVWYASADADALDDMLTDSTGHRHDVSIPPPLVRDDVLERMQRQSQEMLPPAFTKILEQSERPFFTPIYDHHSPRMVDGRVALLGDAACVARPHVGMGVTKAAEDARVLADSVSSDLLGGLAAYEAMRVPASRAAHDRGRHLGRRIFQPDPKNPDGAGNAALAEIMALTAVTIGNEANAPDDGAVTEQQSDRRPIVS